MSSTPLRTCSHFDLEAPRRRIAQPVAQKRQMFWNNLPDPPAQHSKVVTPQCFPSFGTLARFARKTPFVRAPKKVNFPPEASCQLAPFVGQEVLPGMNAGPDPRVLQESNFQTPARLCVGIRSRLLAHAIRGGRDQAIGQSVRQLQPFSDSIDG